MVKLKFALLALAGCALASCGGTTGGESSSEAISVSDGTSSSEGTCDTTVYSDLVKLKLDYKGRDFLKDGIAEVALQRHVDGDTSRVRLLDENGEPYGASLLCRYDGINTPESTGDIQDWGFAASRFTKHLTEGAAHIVISSNYNEYHVPDMDGNGRYLVYVWVTTEENPTLDDFKMVNLMLVEAGLSPAQGVSDSIYSDYFYDADFKAQCEGNYIWSGEVDPENPDDETYSTTIQELVENKRTIVDEETGEEELVDFDWTPEATDTETTVYQVSFECYVAASYFDGGDNAYVYMDYPDYETGEMRRYGLYIFGGYSSYLPLRHPGWHLRVIGTITEFGGNLQITNFKYNDLYELPGATVILEKNDAEYVPVTVTAADIANSNRYVNQIVRVEGLHGVEKDSWADESSGAYSLCVADSTGSTMLRAQDSAIADRNQAGVRINHTNFLDYFTVEGETFTFVGPVQHYVSTSGKTVENQLMALNNDTVIFDD